MKRKRTAIKKNKIDEVFNFYEVMNHDDDGHKD